MPATYLSDLRTLVRNDLHDTDAAAYRWTDAELASHIERALSEFSEASPYTAQLTINATVDVRDYSLAATALVYNPNDIHAVEWPYVSALPAYPPNFVAYSVWAEILTLKTATAPAAGDVIRVWYTTSHTLSETVKTLSPEDEIVLRLGAGAYALLTKEIELANTITVAKDGGDEVSSPGRKQISRFNRLLMDRRTAWAQRSNSKAQWDTSSI